MSETNQAGHREHQENVVDAHTGPIKNPKQLLAAVFFSFVVPIFAIIGLVTYVISANKPAAGLSDAELQKGIESRIQRIGSIEIRDANRPLKTGEEVFKAQCTTCHSTGMVGAPKYGDKADWAARIGHGYEALLQSALHGKGAMAAQGGGDFEDLEIGRAVVYMANAAGASFPVPEKPSAAPAGDAAPASSAQSDPAAAPAPPAPAPAPAAPPAPSASAAPAPAAK